MTLSLARRLGICVVLLGISLAGALPAYAQVVANPQTGTADFGIASRPIVNIAATDTINGAAAVLGSAGNATVAKVGAWPGGIGLDPTTGHVSTTTAVPVGTYSIMYQLCDLNTPPDCATATDTINVINASIVANSQSGTADAGIASRPIANIAATDTIDGAAAVLGSGGNATVAKVGTWPTGLGLNPTTGNVSTTMAVPVGTYSITYQLCDLNLPPDCASATDTVNVINASIVANPQSGTADAGVASRPIANIAATDTVDGAAAVLGTGGNATVAAVGTWPAGISLNVTTGVVSTTASVAAGAYNLQYKLCDLNMPPDCATAAVTVTVVNVAVIANPDVGTADSSVASLPIADVAANDTVNGAPAVLGPSGNAQVGKVGSWPNAIGFNPATGAVSTKISTPDGTYTAQYQLCDLNIPADCATSTVTVTVFTASILANPVSATTAAGSTTTPISNVVAAGDDSVNGAVPVLGTGGNAKVGEVGTWPAGINMTSAGAVVVGPAVTEGTYDFQYELCDLNVPANCASSTIQIVVVSQVVANPDTATVSAGRNTTPIHNVALNDTIDGVEARLQTSPNATVSPLGSWPAGIALNTTTGAVTVASTVAPGLYNVVYQLCNLLSPPTCSTATDTLTVNSLVIANPAAGSALVGVTAVVISNITAYDYVNGAVTLGKGGNARVSVVGTLPAGIALNPGTGAVTALSTVPLGTYPFQYQLCDRAKVPTCSTAAASVTITQPFTEVSVSPYMTGDIEFDWAKDGLFCSLCNFGIGNSQVNWTDRNNDLWVSGVDPTTGMFQPISGRGNGTPVDTNAFFWQDWGNGPEWAFSTPPDAPGGLPVSQLVYTRFAPGEPATWEYSGAAIASLVDGTPTWQDAFLPGAYIPITGTSDLPLASQCVSDPQATVLYANVFTPQQMFTEPLSTASGTSQLVTPFGAYANGIGERFVACTTQLTFQGDVTIGTNTLQQVFWYNWATGAVDQLTFDPTTKQRAVMFRAPEFNGQYALMTLAAADQVQIYEQTGTNSDGSPVMTLVYTIHSPDQNEPWMFDPKVFVNCTAAYPTCRTYVVMGLGEEANPQLTETGPTGMAVASIDPNNPFFETLATAYSSPTQRLDPKYFITSVNGPVLYYDRLLALTNTQAYEDQGVYMINLQLGAPSGPCVGSSANGGLNPTWPNCTAGAPP